MIDSADRTNSIATVNRRLRVEEYEARLWPMAKQSEWSVMRDQDKWRPVVQWRSSSCKPSTNRGISIRRYGSMKTSWVAGPRPSENITRRHSSLRPSSITPWMPFLMESFIGRHGGCFLFSRWRTLRRRSLRCCVRLFVSSPRPL